jgi:hypothetical protein
MVGCDDSCFMLNGRIDTRFKVEWMNKLAAMQVDTMGQQLV